MESNPWKDINHGTNEIIPVDKVVKEMFSGLEDYSSGKVGFALEKVDFFPEEVTYTSPSFLASATAFGSEMVSKKDPHPDFGYNPHEEWSGNFFRYRLLLLPISQYEYRYELFKFKYPILFYPVTLYVEKKNFNLLEKHIPNKGYLKAENITVLKDYITKIIQSESTIELISRLKVL